MAEVPGFGIDSAQQVIAEVGATAAKFSSAAEFTSWVGTCPGKEESAEENRSSRCAKGNKYMRRILNQVAHAAVRCKGTHFQAVDGVGNNPPESRRRDGHSKHIGKIFKQ